jgi:hypothetical protein
MKGFRFLIMILGLVVFVFGPIHVAAQEGGGGEAFTVSVDLKPSPTGEGHVLLDIGWNEVEGAASYSVNITNSSDTIVTPLNPESQVSVEVKVDSGETSIEVVAFNEGDEVISRSSKLTIDLPEPGSVYIGEGTFRLESNYNYTYADLSTFTGEEGGNARFYIYQVEADDGNGKKVLVYWVYGSGRASFMDTINGGGWSTIIRGSGKFTITGTLSGSKPTGNAKPCTMTLNFTTSYPIVYQDTCLAGYGCTTLIMPNWEESHVIDSIRAIAGERRSSTKTVYEVVEKTNEYILDSIILKGSTGCN